MDDLRDIARRADRAASRIPLPERGFERLTRAHAQRGRNQRIAAAGVGLAIGLAAIAAGAGILRTTERPGADETRPVSAPPSTIAFGRVRGEGASAIEQVFVDHPDGTTVQLTYGPDSNTPVAWSPDGSQLLVARTFADGTGVDLYAVSQDGSSQTRLTADQRVEADARWSPDGSRIAFRAGGGIVVMNADGTGEHLLTAHTNDLPGTFDWSPDGQRIAFISVSPRGSELDVADADGTGRVVLMRPHQAVGYDQLAWSPDGSTIAFAEGRGHSTQIALIATDGTHLVRLSPIQAGRPSWSPDGSRISVEGAGGVYVIDVTTGTTDHLTGAGTGMVSWSPDGSVIAIFDGGDIQVMKPDGTERIKITDTEARETNPIWEPVA